MPAFRSGLRIARRWKTKASISIPVPAMVHAMIAPSTPCLGAEPARQQEHAGPDHRADHHRGQCREAYLVARALGRWVRCDVIGLVPPGVRTGYRSESICGPLRGVLLVGDGAGRAQVSPTPATAQKMETARWRSRRTGQASGGCRAAQLGVRRWWWAAVVGGGARGGGAGAYPAAAACCAAARRTMACTCWRAAGLDRRSIMLFMPMPLALRICRISISGPSDR